MIDPVTRATRSEQADGAVVPAHPVAGAELDAQAWKGVDVSIGIELVSGLPTQRQTDDVWRMYDEVFGDQPGEAAWRASVWDKHVGREGFRLAIAYDELDAIGLGYGYTGEHGQWWTDRAAEVLPPRVGEAWLGGHFELVSIGVLPQARGRGVGTELMRLLTDDLPHDRWLLMTTAETDDPARRLYAREGWRVIGPGLNDEQVIMGRERPDLARAKERAHDDA